MLKKILNISIIIIAILSLGLSGCYKTDVAPVVEPGGLGYTSVTVTPDTTGTEVTEGDTIVYAIELSKPCDFDLTFTVKYSGNYWDLTYEPVTIPAYSTSGEMTIVFNADNIPEKDENVTLEIGDFGIGTRSQIVSENPVYSLKIINVNDPLGTTVSFGWPDQNDDFDIFCEHDTYGSWAAGASSADPETMPAMIWDDDPDGIYYVGVDPYDVESGDKIDYEFRIGLSDQSILEPITGTFDYANRDDIYPIITFEYFANTYFYELLEMEKSGTTLTISTYDGTLINTVTLPSSPKGSQRNSVDIPQYLKRRK